MDDSAYNLLIGYVQDAMQRLPRDKDGNVITSTGEMEKDLLIAPTKSYSAEIVIDSCTETQPKPELKDGLNEKGK